MVVGGAKNIVYTYIYISTYQQIKLFCLSLEVVPLNEFTIMKKLSKLSKAIAYFFIITTIVRLTFQCGVITLNITVSRFILTGFTIIQDILMLTWFVMIIKAASKGSNIRISSFTGIVGTIGSIIASIIWLSIHNSFDSYLSIEFTVYSSISVISQLVLTVSFILLATRFAKDSIIQILAISVAVIPLLLGLVPQVCTELIRPEYFAIETTIEGVLWATFMILFSRKEAMP